MTKTFSKKMIYAVIIILIIMLITIAFCCTPSSLIGKSALIRLAVTIPINILFQIILAFFKQCTNLKEFICPDDITIIK